MKEFIKLQGKPICSGVVPLVQAEGVRSESWILASRLCGKMADRGEWHYRIDFTSIARWSGLVRKNFRVIVLKFLEGHQARCHTAPQSGYS